MLSSLVGLVLVVKDVFSSRAVQSLNRKPQQEGYGDRLQSVLQCFGLPVPFYLWAEQPMPGIAASMRRWDLLLLEAEGCHVQAVP